MKYDPPDTGKELSSILNELNSADRDIIVKALLNLVHSDAKLIFKLKRFVDFSQNKDFWVAKTAVNSMADLFRENSDLNNHAAPTIDHLSTLRSRQELVPTIEDAISDIKIFCKIA